MSWLKNFKKGAKRFSSDAKYTEAVTSIKNSEIGISSIDKTFKDIDYVKEGDELYVGGVSWRSKMPDWRMGRFRKGLDDMKVPNSIKPRDEEAFKKVMTKNLPDPELDVMDTKIKNAKKMHSDADVAAESGEELEKKLKPATKAKVTSWYTKLKVAAGTTAIGLGLIGAIVFTSDMFADLANATKERNGCYAVQKLNGKTQSCKILNRSCESTTGTSCPSNVSRNLQANIYIMIHHYVEHGETDLLNQLAANTGITIDAGNVDTVLEVEDNVTKILGFYETQYPAGSGNTMPFDPCATTKFTEGCAACDTTAVTNSPHYTDDSDMPDNINMRCVTNSTMLDTMVDVATNMGVDLFNAASDSIAGIFGGGFFQMLLGIILIIVVVAVILKFIPKSKPKTPEPMVAQPIPMQTMPIQTIPMQTMPMQTMRQPMQMQSLMATNPGINQTTPLGQPVFRGTYK